MRDNVVGDPLDNPVWWALSTFHARLAEAAGSGGRYRADVSVFGAVEAYDDANWESLAALASDGAGVLLTGEVLPDPPPGWTVKGRVHGHQMVAGHLVPIEPPASMRPLSPHDVEAMLALIAVTRPGPFRAGTIDMGDYFGVEEDGRLIAMAGQRLHLPGHTEISAVATAPEARGRGLAAALTAHVAREIAARGETAFLHVARTNDGARRVYERLGFATRKMVEFVEVQPPPASS